MTHDFPAMTKKTNFRWFPGSTLEHQVAFSLGLDSINSAVVLIQEQHEVLAK